MNYLFSFKIFRLPILLGILFFSLTSNGQNETSKWHFGNFAGIDFMTTPPSAIIGASLTTSEGSSGISDAAGNLLFYTDGITVWNSTNAVMAGGTGLFGDPSTTQSAVVVKQPGNANIYYVFTLACCNAAIGVNYSIVDMNLSAGQGSVTVLNTNIAGASSERLTSVKHCNGIDTWVLSQDLNGDFRAHLVTAAGVSAIPVISSIPTNSATGPAYVGYMKFSPNGRKLGLAAANDPTVGFELYDFDASTGIVSNRLFLLQNAWSYGAEFSPDGTKFYGALWGGATLYQWDLCAGSNTAIVNSQFTVATNSGGALQLAKDGKIYMTRAGFTQMGEISTPNVMGLGMNYTDLGQSIAPNTNSYGLPNFITSGLKQPPPPFTYTPNCLSASFTAPQVFQNFTLNACAASGYSLTGMQWNFGNPASGPANTSTLVNPTHVYTGLGTFQVKLILNYSCGGGSDTITQSVIINQPCVNVVSSGVSCFGTGSASVTASSGIGPYTYTWLPSGVTGSVITNLFPGTYSVIVNDAGSLTTYTAPVTVTPGIAYTSTVTNTPTLSCFGMTNGTASIQVSGGSGGQSYAWFNGSTTFTTPTLSNLPAGSYTVTVTDNLSNCVSTKTFVISQPTSNTLTISSGSLTACVNSNLTFTATHTGGTPAYTYTWTAGAQNSVNVVNQAVGGSYIYTVTSQDANNCQISRTIQATYVAMPIPSITANSNTLCYGTSLFLTGSGGNGFSWSGPNSVNGILPNLIINSVTLPAGGIYTLMVTTGPCTVTTTKSITVFPLPTPGFTSPIICENHNLTLTATPGGGTAFAWAGPLNFSSSQQNPVIPLVVFGNSGIYSLTVTDANTCKGIVTGSVTILQNPLVQAGGNTVCFGTPATLIASGAISYQWFGPNGFTANTGTVTIPAATSVSQQTYVVIGTALNSCTNSAPAYVNTTALPIPSLIITPRACVDEMVTLQGFGGNTYQWKGPYNFSASGASVSFAASNIGYAGVFTVTAFDQLGCFASTTGSLKLDPLPRGNLQSTSIYNCIPFCADFSFNQQSSAPLTSLIWKVNGQQINTPGFNYCFTTAGKTFITAQLTDNIGCSNTASFEVNAHALPVAKFDFYPESPIEGIDQVEFVNTSTGSNLTEWNWYFINNDGERANTKNTSHVFRSAGVYPVAMTVRNTWGCMDTIVKTVKVENDFGIYVPNAFTPNQDSKNDVFTAKGIGIVKYNLMVYSRWGQKMFESSDIFRGWDGTFKGEPCQNDVYIWKLSAVNQNGKEILLDGYVTLYR